MLMIDRGRQERQRVFAWMEELKNHVRTPFAPVTFEGFETTELLTVDQALAHPKAPFPVGTPWGGAWSYGWFSAHAVLPQAVQGRRIVLLAGVGNEMTVYCNGRAAGSIDKQHHEVTVSACAKAEERLDLLIECYAGHGERLEALGPCPPDRSAIPPIPGTQCRIAPSFLAVWNETAFQLLMDVQVLGSLLQVLPDRSLRAQKVAQALLDFTRIVDFEQPADVVEQSFQKAREALAPALACRNGDTAPTLHIFGQSHIDLAWLWPVEETLHKSVRTYANQLSLLKEYPEYRFMACEPALLEMLQAQNPALFAEVRQLVQTGQLEAEGAFYVECDTNIPSGESLIRQIVRGRRWFRENMNADTRVGWLPDTFGFSAALPQILQGCGVTYFATQKLLRQDPECQPFPYQNFWWDGLDGTRVLAHMFFNYGSELDPQSLHRRWYQDRVQQRDIEGMLCPFGYGDGGGGATRTVLEQQRRANDLEGVPRTRYTRLREFFETMPAPKNRWVGELYLAWHRGTYTAQQETKRLARRLEFALNDLEKALALLRLAGKETESQALRQGWDTLLPAQFHDVIGGVGIRRVHQTANDALRGALETVRDAGDAAWREALGVRAETAVSVLHPHAWQTQRWVRLPETMDGVRDAQGSALPCYTDDQASYAYIMLPAMGAAALYPSAAREERGTVRIQRHGNAVTVSNEFFDVTFDSRGQITSLLTDGLEWVAADKAMNRFRLYQDVNPVYDAWELARDYQENEIALADEGSLRVAYSGDCACVLESTRTLESSTLTQRITVRAHTRRIDFDTKIDWQVRRRLLKADFATTLRCEDALHEIQFGCIRRPAHRSHAFAADRYEVCNQRYSALTEPGRGLAVLNDGSYGISAEDGTLSLSLLRAPLVPDDTCDRGEHRIRYALYPYTAGLDEVVREGYALNDPPRCFTGACAEGASFSADDARVVPETVKPADDGGGVILRLYEATGASVETAVHAPMPCRWCRTDMAETNEGGPVAQGDTLPVSLRPFEILTLRIIPL